MLLKEIFITNVNYSKWDIDFDKSWYQILVSDISLFLGIESG